MKELVPKLSENLFKTKLEIEKELAEGNKYGITNLFLIDVSREARAFYTNTSQDEFKILQIILEVHRTHKEYERKGGYT